MRALILDNIRSSENVGALFRTADGLGVTHIYLCGYTPAPTDRFGRPNAKIAKTALGAHLSVAWSSVADVSECVLELQKKKVHIVALEQDPRAVPLTSVRDLGLEQKRWALVAGNEILGVNQQVLDLADTIVCIPMQGSKESLNVSVAAGIALYALTSRGA
ncbi:MAG: TrmH family RNA methyltransferase [Patescibacteria group bacterium]